MHTARSLFVLGAIASYVPSALSFFESSILPSDFRTENSMSKAVAVARDSGKGVILYYTRTNCPPCNALQARLKQDDVGKLYRESYVFTAAWGSSMSSAEREDYRARYGVLGAPTWLLFTNEGQYVCTSDGGFRSQTAGVELHQAMQTLLAAPEAAARSGPRHCM